MVVYMFLFGFAEAVIYTSDRYFWPLDLILILGPVLKLYTLNPKIRFVIAIQERGSIYEGSTLPSLAG